MEKCLLGTNIMVRLALSHVADYSSPCDRHKFGKGDAKAKRIMPGYTIWVNLLDYSAAVLPVTLANKNVDVIDKGYKPLSPQDEKVWEACELLIPVSISLC